MKDRFLSASLALVMVLPLGASAQNPAKGQPPPALAIQIRMTGNGNLVDQRAFDELMTFVGSLIANRTVDRYIVNGIGVEGGLVFCIQASLILRVAEESILKRLGEIKPNRGTTDYSTSRIRECRIEQ